MRWSGVQFPPAAPVRPAAHGRLVAGSARGAKLSQCGAGMTPLLIQYKKINASRVYGNSSIQRAPHILSRVRALRPHSVVDYGCGQSRLADLIGKAGGPHVVPYDPAIPAHT